MRTGFDLSRVQARTVFAVLFIAASILQLNFSQASSYFVKDTVAENGITPEQAGAATALIKNAVGSRGGDRNTINMYSADYVLQPQLIKLGESYVLTLEKNRVVPGGFETLYAAQSKIASIDQLDDAARDATYSALNEPLARPVLAETEHVTNNRRLANEDNEPAVPFVQNVRGRNVDNQGSSSAASTPRSENESSTEDRSQSGVTEVEALPLDRKIGYWSLGVGAFLSNTLDTDRLLYNLVGGYTWDINPRAAVKLQGEGSLSSGGDSARFFNLATGASFFFRDGAAPSSPYITGDFGYGFAANAGGDKGEGVSVGTGLGLQFFRTTENTLDLLVRYAMIFDEVGTKSNPSVYGVRLAVNF